MNDTKTHTIGNTQTMKTISGGVDFGVVQKEKIFSEETIHSLNELGRVLQKIHRRLIRDGYTIENGKCYKIGDKNDIVEIQDVYEKCS